MKPNHKSVRVFSLPFKSTGQRSQRHCPQWKLQEGNQISCGRNARTADATRVLIQDLPNRKLQLLKSSFGPHSSDASQKSELCSARSRWSSSVENDKRALFR